MRGFTVFKTERSALGGLSGAHFLEGDLSSLEFNELVLMLLSRCMSVDERRVAQDDFADAAFHAVFVERRVKVDEALVFPGNGKTAAVHHLVTVPTAVETSQIQVSSG